MKSAKNRADFNCVEMKREAQGKLQAEYEKRKKEFDSYSDFLKAKVKESPWQKALLEKPSKKPSKATA